MPRLLLAGVAIVLMASPALYAQSDSAIAVGVAWTLFAPAAPGRFQDHPSIGLMARMRRGTGPGGTLGMEFFKADVKTEIGGQMVPLGTMNIRPVMVGASFSRQYHRFVLSAALVAGYSFNSLRPTGDAQAAYRDRLGVSDARWDVRNSLATRPDVTVWYELGNHFGISASLAYLYVRPTLVTDSRLGRRTETLNASATVVTFGIVYGIF